MSFFAENLKLIEMTAVEVRDLLCRAELRAALESLRICEEAVQKCEKVLREEADAVFTPEQMHKFLVEEMS